MQFGYLMIDNWLHYNLYCTFELYTYALARYVSSHSLTCKLLSCHYRFRYINSTAFSHLLCRSIIIICIIANIVVFNVIISNVNYLTLPTFLVAYYVFVSYNSYSAFTTNYNNLHSSQIRIITIIRIIVHTVYNKYICVQFLLLDTQLIYYYYDSIIMWYWQWFWHQI